MFINHGDIDSTKLREGLWWTLTHISGKIAQKYVCFLLAILKVHSLAEIRETTTKLPKNKYQLI